MIVDMVMMAMVFISIDLNKFVLTLFENVLLKLEEIFRLWYKF